MRKIFLILVLVVGLTGCASRGTEIKQGQLKQLVIGQTTRIEMIAMFGQPVNQGFLEAGKLSLKWVYVYAIGIGGIQRFQELVALFNDKEILEKFFISDNNEGARLGK
jgi:hypothetical protein